MDERQKYISQVLLLPHRLSAAVQEDLAFETVSEAVLTHQVLNIELDAIEAILEA